MVDIHGARTSGILLPSVLLHLQHLLLIDKAIVQTRLGHQLPDLLIDVFLKPVLLLRLVFILDHDWRVLFLTHFLVVKVLLRVNKFQSGFAAHIGPHFEIEVLFGEEAIFTVV